MSNTDTVNIDDLQYSVKHILSSSNCAMD